MAARKKYRVGKSKIQGDGAFAKKDIMPGEHIGKVHTINQLYTDYDFTELGKKHNHSETPNVQNILVGNERHLIATKPIKKGEELTSNYRLQPDLEQPDEFKSGGTKPHKAQLGTLLKASKAVAPAAKVNRLNHLKELVKMRQEGVDLVNFFENLGWTPEGRQLWNDYLSKGNTVVLTGGRELAPGADAISTGKRAWAKKNLNLEGDKVIVEKQKAKYANPESILIDDLESNVNKFREAGGHAILHTDINNTIKQLQEHMRMNPTHKIFTDLDGVLVDLQGGVEKFRAPKKQNGGWLDKYEKAQFGTLLRASKAIKPASKALRAAELSKVTGLTSKMKDYSKSVMPTAKKAAPVKKAGINPLAIADEIIPMPLAPQNLLGMPGGWMELSPMNLVPGYGSKLSAKSAYPNFIGFRKFGNSLDDVIERQALSPKGGSPLRIGRSQTVSEGNWAAVGEPDENYKGVFAATMNPQVEGSNILLQRIPNRYGIVGTTKEGSVDIPLSDPGLSFSRRLPFSTRYVPVNKQKLINNEFQLATMSPRLQSLVEKYGVGLGLATLFGATDLYNKYTIDPIKEQLGNLFGSDTQDDKKKNGGWLDKYEEGGVLKQKTHDNYGTKPNANNSEVSLPPGFVGMAYNTKGRNYSPAWGGQFQMGGSLPGAVGFTYARTAGAAPANGPYAKKTKASAQNGQEMKYYQEGLDFKPKTISQDGSKTPGKPKKKTLILAEEPFMSKGKFNPKNPFAKEAENIKKYVNKYFPDEEVEIIPAYKESFTEGLKKSDPNTRLVFLGHYGRNLFGIPSDEVVKTLSKTPYENCYGGTCYGSDLSGIGYANQAEIDRSFLRNSLLPFGTDLIEYQGLKRAPESYNLRNFNIRTDHVPWLGFSPVERGGEEGFRDSFFRRTQNPELIKAYKSLKEVKSQEEAEKIWKKINKMREAGIDIINKPTAANYSELDVVPFPARTKNYPARPIGLQAGGIISRLSRTARVPLVAGRDAAQTARVLREIRDAGKAIKPNRLLYETVEGSADAAAIKRYQDTKNYIKDLVSKPEVKQAFKDVADIRTKSVPVNQMDPAYTQAITDPDLPLQAVDEIDRSLMTLDPAEVALTKEQSDYVKNLGNLTTDFGLITGSNLQPDDYFRFLMENSDNISPRDIVPLVYSIPNISSQQRSALLQSLATQMPAKASPIARYTAAQDLFALADNYSQLPREIQTVPGGFMSIPQSSYLSNQMRQAFRHLAIDAKTARPTIQIAEPYYTRYAGSAGRAGSANTIIGSLFRSPFRGIPTQAERAASTREISRQIFGRQKSIFSQPKPEDYADLIDYEAALRNYESNKAFTWIGSGSLSADSYEISQRAAKMADKLNLDIIPMHGGSRTSVVPSEANTFAGITKFGQKRGEVQKLLQEAMDKRMLGTLTPEQQRLVSSHRMGLDPSYLHNLMIESRQANALNAELNKMLGINLPATTIDPLYNTLQRPLLGYRIKQDGGEIEKAQGGKLIRSALPKAGRAARATAAELRAASNLLRETNVADEAASALRQRQAARQAVTEKPRATKVVKEAGAEKPKATAASTQKPMYNVSPSMASPESVRAFTENQSKLKDIFSTPEARQAIRDVAESRSASPIAQLDPAYIEAINNPEIATQAIDELVKSLMASDPATVALNKNQVKYARNLGSFATDLKLLDRTSSIPESDVVKFIEEFSGDLATTDLLPLIKSLKHVSPNKQISLIKRLVDTRKQAPLVSSALAPYTAAQDLLVMAENYRGLPGISPGVDYISNQAHQALGQLVKSAQDVRPRVYINPDYWSPAGNIDQALEIFGGLFRSPYTKLPSAADRAAASQEVAAQLFDAKRRVFSAPKRGDFFNDIDYDDAIRHYNSTRGRTFIGSESLSADSYDMTHRTARMKDKLDFDLVPMWQTDPLGARPSVANTAAGISDWGSKRGIHAKSMQEDLRTKFLKDLSDADRTRFNLGRESIEPRTINNLMLETRLANATNAELNKALGLNLPTSVVSPLGGLIERPLIGFIPKQKGGGNVEKGHPVAQTGIRYRRSIDPDVYTSTMTVDGEKFPIKDVYDFYLEQGMVSPEEWRDVMYAEGKLLPEVIVKSKIKPNTLGGYRKEFDTWDDRKNIFPYSVFANQGIISPYSPSANKGISPMGYQMIMEKQRLENYKKDRLAEEKKKWTGAPGWARSIVGRTAGSLDQRLPSIKQQIKEETGPTEDLLQNAFLNVYRDLTDYQATKLLGRSPQGRFQDRRNWIDKSFTPAEQDVLFSSSVLPQPNIYAKTLQGILGAGEGISDFFIGAGSVSGRNMIDAKNQMPYEERMKLPFYDPFRASPLAPGIHPKEADRYNSPLGLVEPFFITTKMTQGLLNQAGLTDIKTPQGEKYTPLMGLAGWQNDASFAQDLLDPFLLKSLGKTALTAGTKGLMKTGAVRARDLVKGRQLLKGAVTPPKLVMPKQRSGGKTVNKADEYPIEKLDQSLNFTNYNKPTKGGWLDKYQ